MATKAGVGKSMEPDASEAGAEAAKAAMLAAGTETAILVMVAATVGYDQPALLAGVRAVIGDAPLIGCTGGGVINQDGPDESLRRVAVTVIASDTMTCTPVLAHGINEDAAAAGKDLASQLNAAWPTDPQFLLLISDGLKINPDKLFQGLESTLTAKLPFIGGTAGETSAFKNTYQYFNDQVLQDVAIGVLFAGTFTYDVGVSHGSRPVGITREVTKAEGNHIFEIDHKPAFEVFKEFLGADVTELTNATVSGVCLGVATPEEAREAYEDVALRIPIALDKDDGSIYIAGEWPVGTQLLVCRRDPESIIRRATEIAEGIKARHDNKDPLLVMHFDCAGRSKTLIGEETAIKEVAANQVFGKDVPWFGFYTFGEIAPILDKNYFHNWTSVVLAIYE
jgi:hypothetical protein